MGGKNPKNSFKLVLVVKLVKQLLNASIQMPEMPSDS